MRVLQWFLDLLYPRKCLLCRKILSKDETDLCTDCRINAPVFPLLKENLHPDRNSRLQFLDSFAAVWYYEGNVRASLLRYKFNHARNLSSGFGRLLAMKLSQYPEREYDVLTWVPVSAKRARTRGYDQSYLLAKAVGKELGMEPVRLLKKIRHNPPQSGMPADRRKANVLGAYTLSGGADLTGKRILLLDDIFTTGATAEECARMLLTAGAKEVHCGAVAAASRQSGYDRD